jgi:EAL domain-containing protein (putative c-di-GMP-specific phosphodiesterase class I)/ActR/RegA family two-component response regulator
VLLHELREIRPSTAFVLMSGYSAGSLSAPGPSPGTLLPKPFSPSQLRAAVARASAGVTRPSSTSKSTSRGAPYRALVADDDESLRQIIVRLLRKAEFEVDEVDSGANAIAAVKAGSYDVILSDVQMPDGDGLELLRAARRVDLDVPVILMTGEPSVEGAASALEYGAFRYLVKPVDNATLVSCVKHAARAHALARIRREAYQVTGAHVGVTDRAGLEVRFEQALERMWMAFQPIVHARTGALFGAEALVRSTEPTLPNPNALLDAATQLGRLPHLGRRVRALASEALALRGDFHALFVNLHPDDLLDAELVSETSPLTQLASRVILEVTERRALESSPELTARIARLRELGFRLAVDDIGAGYSGLTSFTELMPEVVKIDMSLVRDVHKSALKQRTIAALCRLCHESGTLVVAEGVEAQEEREMIVELGCDLIQGYLLGRPQRELP